MTDMSASRFGFVGLLPVAFFSLSTEVADSPYCANTISLVSNSARKNLNAA